MRSVSPAGQAILDSSRVPIAFGARIQRRDGQIYRMISHDRDITVDIGFGTETYKAIIGPNISAMENSANFQADNLEISGFLYEIGITEVGVRDGRFDGADVYIFYLFWSDLTIPAVQYNRYTIGDGSTLDLGYQFELKSLLSFLNSRLYRTMNLWCDTEFMGSRCGVVKDPPLWQASTAYANADPRNAVKRDHVKPTVYNDRFFRLSVAGTSGATEPAWNLTVGGTTTDGSATWITERARFIQTTIDVVTNRRTFTVVANTDAPDNLLSQGLVVATSGDNAGPRPLEIDQWILSTKQIVLVEGFARDPQSGDGIDISLPCSKTISSETLNCTLYANNERYVGWPNKPGDHALLNPGAA